MRLPLLLLFVVLGLVALGGVGGYSGFIPRRLGWGGAGVGILVIIALLVTLRR